MKTVLRPWTDPTNGRSGANLDFWCPGCDDVHLIETEGPYRWEWDGDRETPTISPSILVTMGPPSARRTCHSFIRNGQWEFLGDCWHELAGQTVPMVDVPDWLIG